VQANWTHEPGLPPVHGQNNLNQTTIRTMEVSAEPAKLLTDMIKEADPKDLITTLQGADEERRTAVANCMQDF
jgi:hypothetical protein